MRQIIAFIVSFGAPTLVVAVVFIFVLITRKTGQKNFRRKKLELLEVSIGGEEKGLTKDLLTWLTSLRSPFVIEMAVHDVGTQIHYYIGVRQGYSESLKAKVRELGSGAKIEKAEDYTIFGSATKTCYAKKVTEFGDADIFKSIFENFSKIEVAGEGMALQVIAKLAKRPSGSLNVNLRLLSSALSPYRAEELMHNITNALPAVLFSAESKRPREFVSSFISRDFDISQATILTATELAAIWRLA